MGILKTLTTICRFLSYVAQHTNKSGKWKFSQDICLQDELVIIFQRSQNIKIHNGDKIVCFYEGLNALIVGKYLNCTYFWNWNLSRNLPIFLARECILRAHFSKAAKHRNNKYIAPYEHKNISSFVVLWAFTKYIHYRRNGTHCKLLVWRHNI